MYPHFFLLPFSFFLSSACATVLAGRLRPNAADRKSLPTGPAQLRPHHAPFLSEQRSRAGADLPAGATDEFYFFRRAHASLTNAAPTLLDAVIALTNQTYVRATVVPPFLLLHTAEDPLEPLVTIEDQRTADRMKRKHFEKHAVFDDLDWDHLEPILGFDFNTHVTPKPDSHDSWHFFRHSFAEYGLNGWDALRAAALAGKTKFTVKRNWIVFAGDTRTLGKPAEVDGFLLRDAGVIK